jgi:uncharacterized membrane protein (DUF106 family)
LFGLDSWAEILFLSAAFSAANTMLSRKLGIRRRMNEIQAEFKAYQKEVNEALKAKDEKKLERLSKNTERTNALMLEMTVMPWKSLLFSLPLFLLFTGDPWFTHYAGIIPSSFEGFSASLPFDIHPEAVFSLRVFAPATYGARGYFIVGVIFTGILLTFLEQKYDERMARKGP